MQKVDAPQLLEEEWEGGIPEKGLAVVTIGGH